MIRECVTTTQPFNIIHTETAASSDSIAFGSAASPTTTNNCLILAISAGTHDSEDFVGSSNWVNTSLDSYSFFGWAQTALGSGGGWHGGGGQLATAGSFTNWTSGWDGGATIQANMLLALSDAEQSEGQDPSVGTSNGTSTVTGEALALITRTGSAAGTATVSGQRLAIVLRTGTAAGTATTSAEALATITRTGTSAGTATVSGEANANVLRSGTSAGAATVSGERLATITRTGTAAGTSTASGQALNDSIANGTAAGTSTVTGQALSLITRTGSAAGTAAVAGAANANVTRTGTASGTSTADGDISVLITRIGTAAGVATVSGEFTATALANGTAAGAATVTGEFSVLVTRTGTASGTATVAGVVYTLEQFPVTTTADIRDALVTAIQALIPRTHATELYRYAPRKHPYRDFREWAGKNDQACFRKFDLTFGDEDPAGVMHADVWRMATTVELVVAYPEHYAKFGRDNSGDLDDTIRQDLVQLTTAVGLHGRANYPAAAVPRLPETRDTEDGDGVRFAVVTVGMDYYLDAV